MSACSKCGRGSEVFEQIYKELAALRNRINKLEDEQNYHNEQDDDFVSKLSNKLRDLTAKNAELERQLYMAREQIRREKYGE